MSMGKRKAVGDDEQDAFSSWRHALARFQRPGLAKRIKQGANRRDRRIAKQQAQAQREDQRP